MYLHLIPSTRIFKGYSLYAQHLPNTVQKGVTVYSVNGMIEQGDKEMVEYMLLSVELGMEMPEHYMDIVTGVTGCGPSYVSV